MGDGVDLAIRGLAAAFPTCCEVWRFDPDQAYASLIFEGIPAIRIRLYSTRSGVSAEVSEAGHARELLPLFMTHPHQGDPLGDPLSEEPYQLLTRRTGGEWIWTTAGSASDASFHLEQVLWRRWETFRTALRAQWYSSPSRWLDYTEYAVRLPDLREFVRSFGLRAAWAEFPAGGAPSLYPASEPGSFVLAVVGFGGFARNLFQEENSRTIARLESASEMARARLFVANSDSPQWSDPG